MMIENISRLLVSAIVWHACLHSAQRTQLLLAARGLGGQPRGLGFGLQAPTRLLFGLGATAFALANRLLLEATTDEDTHSSSENGGQREIQGR